ncbi:reverse transcriptase domain-containing protein [Tanacetum coccineum]
MLAADHRRQKKLTEALKLIKRLQTHMVVFERQQGPAKGPAQPELPEEAAAEANLGYYFMDTTIIIIEATTTTAQKKIVILTQWIGENGNCVPDNNCTIETKSDLPLTKLKKKMTDKYCPRTEIKKLEVELWELKVKESDKIEKYVGGLPDMIHGSVVASKPKTMQEATEMAIEVMDKRIRTFADRQTESKRKFEDTSRNTQNQQQQQNKRQNTGRAYTAGSGEKKPYGGSKPLCSKCNYHHDGPCAPKCHKCNKVGHFARDCRSTANANNANNANHQRGTGSGQKPTCFECGVQGHFKRECPKLKNNNNRGNQVGGGNAPAKVYAVGHAGTNPDSNVV